MAICFFELLKSIVEILFIAGNHDSSNGACNYDKKYVSNYCLRKERIK